MNDKKPFPPGERPRDPPVIEPISELHLLISPDSRRWQRRPPLRRLNLPKTTFFLAPRACISPLSPGRVYAMMAPSFLMTVRPQVALPSWSGLNPWLAWGLIMVWRNISSLLSVSGDGRNFPESLAASVISHTTIMQTH